MNPTTPTANGAIPASTAAQPRKPGADAAAEKAREFEAVFLGQMANMMLESVEMGDEFSGGHGEQMFRGILAERLGTEMAKSGGIGLAPVVMDQIIRMQGNTHGQ
ncbi:rod-binding protein [Novosphingobium sp. M1R2S20]|uniref:Rod-binding protein n=1 Tax=Novosphingobium rhizovicinum TaxID=3228928 RepID=A0ABV3R9X1_9SPHN